MKRFLLPPRRDMIGIFLLLGAIGLGSLTACTKPSNESATAESAASPAAKTEAGGDAKMETKADAKGEAKADAKADGKDGKPDRAGKPVDPAKEKMRAERRAALRKKIEAVLTPEQMKQLDAKIQSGEKMRRAMASLELTPEQQDKVKAIYDEARAQWKSQSGNQNNRKGDAPAEGQKTEGQKN
jgi:Spy/CpxP family protein refolding chaperone